MANSSILGGEQAPSRPRGTDVDALGPGDSSDSGSDVQTDLNRTALDEGAEGAFPISHGSASDQSGTGERAAADPAAPRLDADLLPDRVGTLPADALDAAVSIDDPAAVPIDQLAAVDDDDEREAGDEDEDADPVGGAGG
jgi:hypothetical protein